MNEISPGIRQHGAFHNAVRLASANGQLVVQPRMGFADPATMRSGLRAVAHAQAATVGTITLDSYTRIGRHDLAAAALASGQALNGYPLIAHGVGRTQAMVAGIQGPRFPIQIRHGSAEPQQIFEAVVDAQLDATEGGPVSYCLPYSRVPLQRAVNAWVRCSEIAVASAAAGRPIHVETFGGCLLGQLCPPGLLVAMSVLEGLFFRYHGLRSLSLSYAQQTNLSQDIAAVLALRELAQRYLPDVATHTVVYTFMGVYPRTPVGAFRLLQRSVALAKLSGAERLIVKTHAEAHRIPTILENVTALEFADSVARSCVPGIVAEFTSDVAQEAERIIDAVLELDDDPGRALVAAFRTGLLDVPFCLHPDNANTARAEVLPDGRLSWVNVGHLPVQAKAGSSTLRADTLLSMLNHNQRRYDREALGITEALNRTPA